jgi:predicted Zn-dependent peptidase
MMRRRRTHFLLSLVAAAGIACGGASKADTVAPTPMDIVDEDADVALVWPDEDFRQEQPEAGETVAVEIPKIETFSLPGGVDVYLVERHDLPIVSMTLSFPLGSMSDPRGKDGLATLAMDLLDEGTKDLDKVAFEERQADLGSSVWASARTEESQVGLRTLRRSFEPTLDLMVAMLTSPGLRTEDLERLQKSHKASLEQRKAAPRGLGRHLWGSVVHGSAHPFGKVRTERSYDAIRIADCQRYVRKLGRKGARLFVVGDITKEDIESRVGPKLAGLQAKSTRNRRPGKPRPRKGTIFFVDVPGATQSQIYVGHPGPARTAKDHEATRLMASILGGGFSSRINMNIREDKGFSYGARAGFSYNTQYGVFAASSAVHAEATGASLREIAKEIATMRTTDVTDEELSREKSSVLLGMPSRFATASRVMRSFSGLVFHGLPLDYYDGFQDRIRSAKVADLRKAAEEHLRESGFKVLVVGDGAVIRQDLEAIAKEGVFGKEGLVVLDEDGKVQ